MEQLTKCKFAGGGHLEQLSNDLTLFIVPKRKNRMKDSCSFYFETRFYVLE